MSNEKKITTMVDACKEMKRKFNIVFGTTEGKYILACLKEYSGIYTSNSSDTLERMEGRKEVLLYIADKMSLDLDKIERRIKQQQKHRR